MIQSDAMTEQDLFYNSVLGWFLGSKAREEIVSKLLMKMKKSDSFLEIGCSEGHYLNKVENNVKRCVGVDIEKEKVEEARKRTRKSEIILMKKNEKLPFKRNEFDWILATEVLEHIPEWKHTLRQMKLIAKKNLLITIPLEKSLWWSTASRLGWKKEMRKHCQELIASDIEKEMKKWKTKYKKFVFSPSTWLNKRINAEEKNSMYAVFLFEKN